MGSQRVGRNWGTEQHQETGKGFPGGARGEEPTCQCRTHKRCKFDPWLRTIPWRMKWLPTPVFLPGEFLGQRSLAGYSPGGHKDFFPHHVGVFSFLCFIPQLALCFGLVFCFMFQLVLFFIGWYYFYFLCSPGHSLYSSLDCFGFVCVCVYMFLCFCYYSTAIAFAICLGFFFFS